MTIIPNATVLRSLYRTGRLIRRTEEILIAEYRPANQMRCPIHFCVGQEATPTVLAELLRPTDVVMCHYRSHGYFLAKGGSLDAMVAEFYGKDTGTSRGYVGSQELSDSAIHFYSGAILAGGFAMATGSAFAQLYAGRDDITLALIGDGGMEEGVTIEAINIAAIRQLPVLFICENNGYAAHTPIATRARSSTVSARAKAFGIETLEADGNDPIALYSQIAAIVADLRARKGPFFLEVKTYRLCAHVGPDSDDSYGYRPPEEIEQWKARDPVVGLRMAVLKAGIAEADLQADEAAIDQRVYDAIAAAKAAPFPEFEPMLCANWSNTYSPSVTHAAGASAAFDGHQAETPLKPY